MLEPNTDPEDGVFNKSQSASNHGGIGAGELPPTDLQVQTLINAHTAPEYLSFLNHTDLRSFVRRLMGWDKEVLLQRTMLRHNAPGAQSTAVHYDKLFLRGGSAYFLTAWVPLGDTAQNGGGLMYLADSADLGRMIEDDFTRRAEESLSDEERISAFQRQHGKEWAAVAECG
jgi:phytanoyl-CoA hydroxylase